MALPNRVRWPALLFGAALVLGSCGGDHSVMSTHGSDADRTALLAWFMFSLAGLITLGVFVLLVIGLFRDGERSGRAFNGHWLIIGGGMILPAVVLFTLSALTVWALRSDPAAASGDVAITVVGHQYWWEVRYPGSDAVTANEIHLPIDTPVRLTLRSADVIHSFWVPALAGKTDLIPGQDNHMTLRVDKAGTYRGQCAEFCGIQHAHMAFVVVAQTPDDYRRWLQEQAAPAQSRLDPTARQGRDVFMQQSCAGCHTIRGTAAAGTSGPDLTHLASRRALGANTLPNDSSHLGRWIVDAQAFKPGAEMPAVPLTAAQTAEIVAYLGQLR